jgi:hypothetical protein
MQPERSQPSFLTRSSYGGFDPTLLHIIICQIVSFFFLKDEHQQNTNFHEELLEILL